MKHVHTFKNFLNESASFKKKEDFSGKKWGTRLAGSIVYTFKSGGHDYILDFTIDDYIANKEKGYSYILRSDIKTKKKEFELVKTGSTFELISTVKNIHKDAIEDLQKFNYDIRGLNVYYSIESEGEKNTRAIIFNRAIAAALLDLGISYDVKNYQEARLNKDVFEYKFKNDV